jgi:hypothetical protein
MFHYNVSEWYMIYEKIDMSTADIYDPERRQVHVFSQIQRRQTSSLTITSLKEVERQRDAEGNPVYQCSCSDDN